MTMIGSILGGSDSIDEPTEGGDGSIDLEYPGGHGLRWILWSTSGGGGFGSILQILKTHLLALIFAVVEQLEL